MVQEREYSGAAIYQEMDEKNRNFWFDYKQKKFLHNIDTFYYSVKLCDDFRSDTNDLSVIKFRKVFQNLKDKMGYNDSIPFYLNSLGENMNLLSLSFGKYYNICLECPDYFHVFIASKVPPGADGSSSVTCEIIVQIRSYMLWMYGVHAAFERSMEYVQAIVDQFNFSIAYIQENRIDYCWHSNYLVNPEKFFSIENFYKMRVDRYSGANFHTEKVGESDYEIDYVSLGQRSGKCFVRIYLKSKEVVEEGYKAFFLQLWFFNGLISRYDLYCYEKSYVLQNWKYVTIARLEYYLEFGSNEQHKGACRKYIQQYEESKNITDEMMRLADELTPKIHLVINVEYQTMRKGTKSYCLIPVKDNRAKAAARRVYDYLDNRPLIAKYLTHEIFRLVDPTTDSRKRRCDYCGFWKALRSCKMVDVKQLPDQLQLIRDYTRKLNKDIMKRALINKAIVYGIYTKGINDDNVMKDCFDALLKMNDNDLMNALRYKKRKTRQFNESELAGTIEDSVSHDFVYLDRNTGEFYDDSTIQSFLNQEHGKEDSNVDIKKSL